MKKYRFVFATPSWNNEIHTEKCLVSMLSQQSSHEFRIIFVDDASTDKTMEVAKTVVQKYNAKDKVTFVENARRRGPVANLYSIIHLCDPGEIIVCLDGDDYLPHNSVLERVAKEYDKGVLTTYGSLERTSGHPTTVIHRCPDDIISERSYRDNLYYWSALRTHYAGLAQKINIQDLCDENGLFLPATSDQATMFPILEMAGQNQECILDVLYSYNDESPMNDFRANAKIQIDCENYVRKLPKYSELSVQEKNKIMSYK